MCFLSVNQTAMRSNLNCLLLNFDDIYMTRKTCIFVMCKHTQYEHSCSVLRGMRVLMCGHWSVVFYAYLWPLWRKPWGRHRVMFVLLSSAQCSQEESKNTSNLEHSLQQLEKVRSHSVINFTCYCDALVHNTPTYHTLIIPMYMCTPTYPK